MIRRAAIALAAVLIAACGPKPLDDSYAKQHAGLAPGSGFVEVGGREARLDHVYYWSPNSFADREGLGRLLATGVDPAPVSANRNLTFRRHRTYPLAAWGTSARVSMVYATGDDRRTHGALDARDDGGACRAEVTGDGIGSGFAGGACKGGGQRVRLAFHAFQLATPFVLPDATRQRLGASQPDWRRTAAYCVARSGDGLPLCGPDALERLTVRDGRQQREPGSGTWILARDGRLVLWLPWIDGEELLVIDAPPPDGSARDVAARSIVVAPDVQDGVVKGEGTKTLRVSFDGAVLWIDRGGPRPRRLVPDPLVVTGIATALLP